MSIYGEIWAIIKKYTTKEIYESIPEELVEALVRLVKKENN